jgi:cellulose synthase/poly-beta-1,6-N-acetylglucosamine synthase-like glycosyltransferase
MFAENAIFSICFLAFSFYAFHILLFTYGWFKAKPEITGNLHENIFVSIVIAARNEEQNISHLLESLIHQDYPSDMLEIIIIDDHSTDNTYTLVKEKTVFIKNLKIIRLNDNLSGKRNAIKYAVSIANGNLIITSDADCIVDRDWIKSIVQAYINKNAKFIIAPVLINQEKTFIQYYSSIEQLSLTACTIGSASVEHPVMCSSANMAFEKDFFEKIDAKIPNNVHSGFDMFWLQEAIQMSGKNISFIKTKEAAIYTQAPDTLKAFINQHSRWASKNKLLKNRWIITTALSVIFINATIVTLFLISFFYLPAMYVFIICLVAKIVIDAPIMLGSMCQFKKNRLLPWYIISAIIYPFVTSVVAIFGIFGRYQWKGRNIQQ